MKKMMASVMALMLVVSLSSCLRFSAFGEGGADKKAVEVQSLTQETSGIDEVSIQYSAGDISIVAGDGEELIFKEYSNLTEKSTYGTITTAGSSLTIAQGDIGPFQSTDVSVEITLPESFAGKLIINTGAGDLTVKGAFPLKVLSANAGAGDIVAEHIAPTELLEAKTGAGDIVVKLPEGSGFAYTVTTGAGEITSAFFPVSEHIAGGSEKGNVEGSPQIGKVVLEAGAGDISLEK